MRNLCRFFFRSSRFEPLENTVVTVRESMERYESAGRERKEGKKER